MRLSEKIEKLEPQLARQMYTKARQYTNVLDLTLGDPDMPTPFCVKAAACEALNENKTHYTANQGMLSLRQAVAEDIERRISISYNPEREIIITPGAMGALYLASVCLVDRGEEALILAPHWPNYTNMILMCDGTPIDINCLGVDTNTIMKAMEAARTDKTKLIVLNSPCNPTGQILPAETLDAIAAFAVKHDLIVFSDEVYSSILFDKRQHDSILTRPGMRERAVLIESLSKRFSMTGWRVGFAAAPRNLIAKMSELQEHTSACVAQFAQDASIKALRDGRDGEKNIAETFEKRCKFMAQKLNSIPGLHCEQPRGTFYLFVDIRKTGMNSVGFSEALLEKKQVAVVPGNAFGAFGEGYIRIACSLDVEKLSLAAERIALFVAGMEKSASSCIDE